MLSNNHNGAAENKVLAANVLNLMTVYTRDSDLSPEQLAAYKPGLLLKEEYFVDVTYRSRGLLGNTRYAIFSNSAEDIQHFEKGITWGLFTIKENSYFKVLDVIRHKDKNLILLMHLPEKEKIWEKFINDCPVKPEAFLINACIEKFEQDCDLAPLQDLDNEEWKERCSFTIGLDDDGNTIFKA